MVPKSIVLVPTVDSELRTLPIATIMPSVQWRAKETCKMRVLFGRQ